MERNPLDRATLGQVIRSLRKAAGLTQEQLAVRSGLHATYVSDIEVGRRNPSFASIDKLLVGLRVTWEQFGRELDASSPPD